MNLKDIQLSNNSELKIIKNNAFSYSSIESIIIPPSLIEFKEKWCFRTSKLTNILVNPNNPYYMNLSFQNQMKIVKILIHLFLQDVILKLQPFLDLSKSLDHLVFLNVEVFKKLNFQAIQFFK